MDVRFVKYGRILVVEVDGHMDGTSAGDFEMAITPTIPDVDQGMICDLSGVPYVSSAGLRVILIVAKRLSKQNAMFSVCGLSANVAEVFRISGFNKIISIYQSREEALAETSRK